MARVGLFLLTEADVEGRLRGEFQDSWLPASAVALTGFVIFGKSFKFVLVQQLLL